MGGYSDIYSDLYGPAFPQTPLDVRAELSLGGVWSDVSTDVYERGAVTITTGHPDESSTAMPSSCALQLNNRLGTYSPRNPLSVNHGLIGENTPMRLSLPYAGGTYLRFEEDSTSYASCPDNARLDITGDLELQVEMELSDTTRCVIVSKYQSAGGHSWSLVLNDDGTARFFWTPTGGIGTVVNSTMPLPLGRVALKTTLATATGTVTFYTGPTISGPWTQLGNPVVTGATSIFSSSAPLVVGADADLADTGGFNQTPRTGALGKLYAVNLLNGIGGTTVASPVFSAQAAGTAMWSDAQGNLWTLSGTAEISDRDYRHYGEVPAWPPKWDVTGRDVYTPIASAGLLRRLGQDGSNGAPLNSAIYRAYVRLTGALAPVAYWPCEDGSASTSLASAIGGAPMTVVGAPQLASDTSFLCSDSLPVLNGSTWSGIVPGAVTTANSFRFLLKVPSSSPPADQAVIARLYTGGTVALTELRFTTGGGLRLLGYNFSGTQIFDTGAFAFGIFDQTLRVSVTLQPSGGNVAYAMGTLAPGAGAALVTGGSVAGSIGLATRVVIAPNEDIAQAVVGHVSVQANYDDLFDLAAALNAWQQEAAGIRFARLCTEEGIASRVYGYPADSVAMGPQRPLKFTDLLQECEGADKGLIFEPRQALALGYRTRASMFNQAAALTLDYSAAQFSPPMEPTDDDQYRTNDVTATRTNGGSSYRAVVTDGRLSIQAPPNGVGRYPSTDSANLFSDAQLGDDASWLAWLGTVDDVRYPSLTVNLARSENASIGAAAAAVKIGDRIVGTNTPPQLPPDGISQIVRGYTEVAYQFTHQLTPVCVPESPYRVGVYDDPVLGRYDTDGSTLYLPVSSSAVSIQVATTNPKSPLWTTDPSDCPFDIRVGGERMTVTAVTGSSSPQTMTVTRSVNGVVKSQTQGADVRLFQPTIYSM